MMNSLLIRDVKKRPAKVRFSGRILFLTEDPDLIKRQLSGEDLQVYRASPLTVAASAIEGKIAPFAP